MFKIGLVPRTRSSPNIAAGDVANFGFKSGTRIIDLLVSFDSEVRLGACCKVVANFGIGTLALVVVLALAACDAVNTVTEGFGHAKAVESDLEQATGVRPNVGFNWNNGRLTSVTVQYPRLVESKPLSELAEAARASVQKEFKQTPENIVLAFSLGR